MSFFYKVCHNRNQPFRHLTREIIFQFLPLSSVGAAGQATCVVLIYATCRKIGHVVVQSQTTLPPMHREQKVAAPSPGGACERGNVCGLLLVAGVEIESEVRRSVHRDRAGK